jgi:hypothetical protein
LGFAYSTDEIQAGYGIAYDAQLKKKKSARALFFSVGLYGVLKGH